VRDDGKCPAAADFLFKRHSSFLQISLFSREDENYGQKWKYIRSSKELISP